MSSLTDSLLYRNVQHTQGTFLRNLRDGEVHKSEFNKLVKEVFDLSHQELLRHERLEVACLLWEFSFLVVQYLGASSNPNDIFVIKNLDSEDRYEIIEKVYALANFFTYNKKLDLHMFFI